MDSEMICFYLRKKKKHFNFANSTGVLKLAGILGSLKEKKGLEAGPSVFRQVAALSAQGSPNAQPLLCDPAGRAGSAPQGPGASLGVCACGRRWLCRIASCEGRPLAASSEGQRSPLYRV